MINMTFDLVQLVGVYLSKILALFMCARYFMALDERFLRTQGLNPSGPGVFNLQMI